MIEVHNLVKTFKNGDVETHVLRGINFQVHDGDFIAIMGRSGAGKSTFLYQMSLLDEPTSGDVLVDGKSTRDMSDAEEIAVRLERFGYVFQDYALLPDLSAIENVALPLLMQHMTKPQAFAKAADALTKVGLKERLFNLPSQLSGGEQQRVSIARAVGHNPNVLFADEPTANLDNESSAVIMDIFTKLHSEGQTIIMVTHEDRYAQLADKIIKFDDGKIVDILTT